MKKIVLTIKENDKKDQDQNVNVNIKIQESKTETELEKISAYNIYNAIVDTLNNLG